MEGKKRKQKYAAFYREHGTRKWRRKHPDIAASKQAILRTYQSWLMYGDAKLTNHELSIRPIRRKKK